jgi:DEAD/DEAH box helicase domain-containing protein
MLATKENLISREKYADFKKKIEENYRGQTVYERIVNPSRDRTVDYPFSPYSPPAIAIGALNQGKLFSHQRDTIELISQRINTLIMLPTGSGKSISSILTSLKKTLEEGKNVLFLYPSQRIAKANCEILRKNLIKMHFDWALDITLLPEDELVHTALDLSRIIVTDVKYVHSHLLKKHKHFENILKDLDLIIIEELQLYRGIFGSNCAYLFRRLRRIAANYGRNPVFLLTSKPIQNYYEFIKKLLGLEIESNAVVNKDGRGLHLQEIIFWVPPIDKVEEPYKKAEEKRFEIRRTDYFSEVLKLVAKGVAEGLNTIIVSKPFPLSEYDINLFGQTIEEILRKEGKTKKGKFFWGDDLNDIRSNMLRSNLDWSDINLVIYAGFKGPISEVRNDIMHIGDNIKTLIYILFPQTPSYQFYVNHPEELFERGDIELERGIREPNLSIDIANKALIEKHFLHLLIDNPAQKEEIEELFQKDGLDIFNSKREEISLEKEEFWCLDENGKAKKAYKELYKLKSAQEWLGLGAGDDIFILDPDNAYEVISEGSEASRESLGLSDELFCYEELYPGSIAMINGRRYRVDSWRDKKIIIRPNIEFVVTFKDQGLNVEFEKGSSRAMCNGKVAFGLEESKIKEKVLGYRSFKNYDIEKPEIVTYKGKDILIPKTFAFKGLRLFFEEVSSEIIHTITHLLLSMLKTVYSLEPKELGKYINDNSIYLYDKLHENIDALHYLNDEQMLLDLFKRSYQILIDCPCENGCPGCIQIFECSNKEYNEKLNKLDTILYLGKLLNKKEEAEKYVRFKSKGIDEEEKLGEIVYKSLFILDKKCKSKITSPYNHKFFDEAERKCYGEEIAGLCSETDKKVYILKGLKEASCYEVVSHEFFHNWQYEGNLNKIFSYYNENDIDDKQNILYRGLVFIEGSSTWAAYKSIDYFGLRELMYSTETRHYAEYREGFILIKYLETKYGLVNTLKFLKNGPFSEYIDLNKLYRDSRIYEMIVEQESINHRNKGELVCLGPEYLAKTTDLVRITHYFKRHAPFNFHDNLAMFSIEDILKKYGSCGENILKEEFIKAMILVLGRSPMKLELPCQFCKSKDKETLLDGAVLIKGKGVCDLIIKRILEECA